MESETKVLQEKIDKMKNVLQEEKKLHARLQKEIEVSFNHKYRSAGSKLQSTDCI